MARHDICAVKYAGPFEVYSGDNVWQQDMATSSSPVPTRPLVADGVTRLV